MKELRDLGFVEISPWYWKMDQPWIDLVKADEKYLDLRIRHQPVELALHSIRTLFRFRCFENLSNHPKRRDSEWLRETVGYDKSLTHFARIDLVRTRQQLSVWILPVNHCSLERLSRSWLGRCIKLLPLCAAGVGTHQHLFWDCAQNILPNGRPPDNPLQLRFGWFVLGNDSLSQLYCDHMTSTAFRILTLHHGGAEDEISHWHSYVRRWRLRADAALFAADGNRQAAAAHTSSKLLCVKTSV